MTPVLEVERLSIAAGGRRVVEELSFHIAPGEALALVGESGSGKSATGRAVIGLLPPGLAPDGGEIRFEGAALAANPAALRRLRGPGIGMVFQEPMTSLNPAHRIGAQMAEGLALHTRLSRKQRRDCCIAMLERVGITDPASRLNAYPHEFSGGMRQRIMIAMALLCRPRLLIADEPTTALDVTVQAQIMKLLGDIRRDFGTSVILITHDLGVVAGFCDRILVMYGGQVMEEAPTEALFANPTHPYTRGLLSAVARIDREDEVLRTIAGDPPDMSRLPPGCPFSPRCAVALPHCAGQRPALAVRGDRRRACHLAEEQVAAA